MKTGWYSLKQAANFGSLIYRTPTGEDVEVTTITSTDDRDGILWDDLVCRGPVVDYVRVGIPPARVCLQSPEPYGFLEVAMTSAGPRIHQPSGVRAEDLIIDDVEASPARVERFTRETWELLIRNLGDEEEGP